MIGAYGEWVPAGMARDYAVWQRQAGGGTIYNVTKNGLPPSAGAGGYPDLESVLRLKGIDFSDFEQAAAAPLRP